MSYGPILGVALAGAVASLYAAAGADRSREAQEVQFDAQVADDLSAAADALSTYLATRQGYYSGLFKLKDGNPGWLDWSIVAKAIPDAPPATNRLGQTLSVLLRAKAGYDMDGNGVNCESDANEPCPIDAYIVTTDGTTVNDARVAAIANRVTKGRGGGVYDVMHIITGNPHDYAGNSYWSISRSQFGPYPFPTPGHPIAYTVIGGANADITSLSRYPHPTRNTLHTNLSGKGCDDASTPAKEGCNLNDFGDVSLATGQSLARSIADVVLAGENDVVPKPSCPSGLQPTATTAWERMVYDSFATPTQGARSWLEDETAQNRWRVRIRFITQNDYNAVPESKEYARVNVLIRCS